MVRNFIFGAILFGMVSVAGGFLLESVYSTFISLKMLIGITAIASLPIGVAYRKKLMPFSIAAGIMLGIVLSPYMQFLVGAINIFVIDPPNLRESVSVPELRVQFGEMKFTDDKGKEVTVMGESQVHRLVPGENAVNIGALNIPAGSYTGGKMHMKLVEVDVSIDLDKEVELAMGKISSLLPELNELESLKKEAESKGVEVGAGISTAEIKSQIRDGIVKQLTSNAIAKYLPPMVVIKNVESDASTVRFTIAVALDPVEFPISFTYPTGRGGPDVVLDILINQMGFPTSIQPIVKLPPGAPDINIPGIVPAIPAGVQPPTEVGLPPDVLLDIRARLQEAKSQALAAKSAAEASAMK